MAPGRWHDLHERRSPAQRHQNAAPANRNFEAAILDELPRLRRLAGALAGCCGDDLVQDCLAVALERQAQWRGDNLSGWLNAIMRSIDSNRRRHDRVLPMMVLDEDIGLEDRAAETREMDRIGVEAALDRLEPCFRAVVILRDIEGYNYEEIAEMLSIPCGTVMSRLARARHRMAETLSAA
ncbi:RNA polymerase sigma factor [Martelella limonii]|uniref:RNA polymerase sigma factor n=1 Tax=Martelella limonii TaxID=1647649 RepID=UPI00158119CC|nr:RNA polymerase sigma factor [Martelella limonii]